jgi:chromosome segregation ATPase
MREINQNIVSARRNLEEVDSVSRSSIDGKIAELNSRLEQLEVEIFGNEELERSLSDHVKALRSEVDRLENSNAQERLNEFEDELVELETEIESIDTEEDESDEIGELRERIDDEFSEIERRMHENESELDELRTDVAHISEVLRRVISKNFF